MSAPGTGAFQPEHATVLYEKAVRVRVQRPDREDCVEELQVRLALDQAQHQPSGSATIGAVSGLLARSDGSSLLGGQLLAGRILRLQLTSEDDPFFLHTMEVSEEDFQTLKADQAILVDFGAFPQEVIALLDECAKSAIEANPAFRALLRLEAGFSTFSVLEVNKFKHLSHLTLRCRPGNDPAVKHYLACRLWDVKANRATLAESLQQTRARLEEAEAAGQRQAAELAEHRERSAASAGEMRNEQAAKLNSAKQQALQELEEAARRFESEKAALEGRRVEQVSALEARNAELDAQVRTLMEQKYGLDSKVSELSAKHGSASGELSVAREELDKLRAQNKELDAQAHASEKTMHHDAVKITALEQQAKDATELLQTLRGRLESSEAHRRALEESLQETRSAAARSEERVTAVGAEIRKGNQIIEKLQTELRSAKAKAKLKASVITQQENLLQERHAAMDKLSRELATAQLESDGLREERASLQSRIADQTKKLEESQALLQSNHQMIQWLNQQVNEAQLGTMGSSSRYSFRPSSLALQSAVSARTTATSNATTYAGVPTSTHEPVGTRSDKAPVAASSADVGPVTYRPRTVSGPPASVAVAASS